MLDRVSGSNPVSLTRRQRDLIHLTAYVLAQHHQYERADILMQALEATSAPDTTISLGRAVLAYFRGDYATARGLLERIDVADPIERFGNRQLSDGHKMRRYLKARCYRELGQETKMRDAIDIYLQRLSRTG